MAVAGEIAGRRARAWQAEPSLLVGIGLVGPLVVLLGLIFVVPIARVFWIAFTDPTLGFANFREFFESPTAVRALLTTFKVSAVVTVLSIGIGVLVAWELRSARSPFKRLVLWSAVLFPLWTSIIVRNYAFTILLQRKGILNETLLFLGFVNEPINVLYTDTAVAVGMLYTMLPYAILPLYASFVNIDDELINAAESLGASRLRAIASVVVSLTLPSMLAAAAIVFVVSVGFYITPIILGGPDAPFLATVVEQQIFLLYNFPGGAATGSILFVAAIVVVGLAWRAVGFERIQRAVA